MSDALLVLIPGLALGLLAWWALGRPRLALAAPLVLISVLIALIAVWKLASVRAGVLGPTLLHVETDRPQVALTLDDGPTSAYTNAVLDLLDAADARATFFVTGAELSERPDLGRAILDRGHQLGNHSWSHPRLIFASQAALRDEIERTDAAIRALGVEGDIPFRPPYGKRLLGLHAVLGDRPAVMWDIEPESYDELSHDPDILAAHVIDRARPGSIVLLHVMYESRETTRLALPRILEGLRQKGLQVVTLAELQHP